MGKGSGARRVVRSYPFGPVDRLEIDPLYAWLQEHEPLSRVSLPYGDQAWLLVRYDDVRTALSDPRFSLAEAVCGAFPGLLPGGAGACWPASTPPSTPRLRPLPPRP